MSYKGAMMHIYVLYIYRERERREAIARAKDRELAVKRGLSDYHSNMMYYTVRLSKLHPD